MIAKNLLRVIIIFTFKYNGIFVAIIIKNLNILSTSMTVCLKQTSQK